jgi:hypothetical protein
MVCSFGLVAKWLQGQYYYAGTACPKFIAGSSSSSSSHHHHHRIIIFLSVPVINGFSL